MKLSILSLLAATGLAAASEQLTALTTVEMIPSTTITKVVAARTPDALKPRATISDKKLEKWARGAFLYGNCDDFCENYGNHWRCNLDCYPPTCPPHQNARAKPIVQGCGGLQGPEPGSE